jgi:hypothetical protein
MLHDAVLMGVADMNDLVDSLRSQIEEQHAKALEALKVLAGYLGNPNLLNGHTSPRQASVGLVRNPFGRKCSMLLPGIGPP